MPDAIRLELPLSRSTDPPTSRAAAESVRPGNAVLIGAIRAVVSASAFPIDAFEIAARVDFHHPDRWADGTIRTAVKRAGLTPVDALGRSPRGHSCRRYRFNEPTNGGKSQ